MVVSVISSGVLILHVSKKPTNRCIEHYIEPSDKKYATGATADLLQHCLFKPSTEFGAQTGLLLFSADSD